MKVVPIHITKRGKVFLVGAGPGDPDLITVRGLKVLRAAEVIVYDRLANPDLLSEAHPESKKIYVGKTCGRPSASQDQINQILVHEAQKGKNVVRLKGGDPFVFGRGGEELEVLANAGIPFEVVPGISSSVAAAAFAGIPLTHRNYSSSFTVITGHSIHKDAFAQKWEYLARCDTLVILMGLNKLEDISRRLIENGREASTPVAVIEKASYNSQKKAVGTLSNIAEKAKQLSAPATIVIGEVVKLSDILDWYDPENLQDQSIADELFSATSLG